jgi:hypothetical protein
MKTVVTAALAAFLAFAAAAQSPSTADKKQDAAAEPAAQAASASAAAPKPPADPAAPKPFDEVVQGATRQDGLFPIWRKDEKVWIEVPKEMVGKPFLFTANIAQSVGERGLYASQMAASQLAQFRIVGRQLQLLAINTNYRAVADQGSKRAIDQAFSPSLIGAAALASAEHPKRQSWLVDASFLLSDIPGYSTRIEQAFRLPFAVDRANSSFERLRAEPGLSTLTARIHFATSRIPAPPMVPAPSTPPPLTTPDPRSFFVDFVYSFLALPEEPMRARSADPRLGHFTESFTDLGDDFKANPRTHYVTRWRLEKKDPAAALSEPVKPIVFWLDKNIPPRYRPSVIAGVLEWNKAFERIGFKDAIVARQQPDDADWDNMDAGHASIRWFVGADVGFAIGPHHTDPRTGEILDADIGMSDVFGRGARRAFVEEFGRPVVAQPIESSWPARAGRLASFCEDSRMAAMDTAFALELLEAREEIGPDSPEAEAFVKRAIKGTIMHEVGHVLGLKHNFKGSTTVTAAQLQDRAYTETHGLGNSVMEYVPVNLALKGERQGSYHRDTLGAYDHWAIEYAYKPTDPTNESQELAQIAARSTDPQLAYADDIQAGWGSDGMDPMVNRFDLGDNPLAWFRKRLALSQELWARTQERTPRAGDDPTRARRAISSGFWPLAAVTDMAAKYVGGMHASRELPGSGSAAFTPVDPAQQREALRFLEKGLFSADSFRFKPEFLSTLSVDYNEASRPGPVDIASAVARVQFVALDRLMSSGTASRLLELPSYVPVSQRKGLISLNEVYQSLQRAVWSELASGGEIDRLRRNLQREHLRRLQSFLTRGAPGLPADAVSLIRYNAVQLEAQLRSAVAKNHGSVETRAHLAESLDLLSEALRAKMQRS